MRSVAGPHAGLLPRVPHLLGDVAVLAVARLKRLLVRLAQVLPRVLEILPVLGPLGPNGRRPRETPRGERQDQHQCRTVRDAICTSFLRRWTGADGFGIPRCLNARTRQAADYACCIPLSSQPAQSKVPAL